MENMFDLNEELLRLNGDKEVTYKYLVDLNDRKENVKGSWNKEMAINPKSDVAYNLLKKYVALDEEFKKLYADYQYVCYLFGVVERNKTIDDFNLLKVKLGELLNIINEKNVTFNIDDAAEELKNGGVKNIKDTYRVTDAYKASDTLEKKAKKKVKHSNVRTAIISVIATLIAMGILCVHLKGCKKGASAEEIAKEFEATATPISTMAPVVTPIPTAEPTIEPIDGDDILFTSIDNEEQLNAVAQYYLTRLNEEHAIVSNYGNFTLEQIKNHILTANMKGDVIGDENYTYDSFRKFYDAIADVNASDCTDGVIEYDEMLLDTDVIGQECLRILDEKIYNFKNASDVKTALEELLVEMVQVQGQIVDGQEFNLERYGNQISPAAAVFHASQAVSFYARTFDDKLYKLTVNLDNHTYSFEYLYKLADVYALPENEKLQSFSYANNVELESMVKANPILAKTR